MIDSLPARLTSLYATIAAAGPKPRTTDRWALVFEPDWRGQYNRRETFCRDYAYAVPTEEAIQRILAFADGPIVEIGAGRGLWAHLLQLAGGTVRPTDIAASGLSMLGTNEYLHLKEGATWTHIEALDAVTAARTATEPTLLTIWPAYMGSWSGAALKAFTGQRVVYVGESDGGCTGDEPFHEELAAHWTLDSEVAIPQWWGIHDNVWLYRRT